jgi:hypothetical protein
MPTRITPGVTPGAEEELDVFCRLAAGAEEETEEGEEDMAWSSRAASRGASRARRRRWRRGGGGGVIFFVWSGVWGTLVYANSCFIKFVILMY